MIDYQPQIFTAIADHLREVFPGIKVTGDVTDDVAVFPCVQVEESSNIDTRKDNGQDSQYAQLQYRIRVFSSKKTGRISQARRILAEVDYVLAPLNFTRKTYLTQNGLYNNSAYKIDTTYEAVIGHDGTIYRG